ncbi:hypothetical protein RA25_06220 [Leisingera sp. ANG-S5]|nr:hypothetical protein RA25_06220 [Leisingera sp. ANG-S5]
MKRTPFEGQERVRIEYRFKTNKHNEWDKVFKGIVECPANFRHTVVKTHSISELWIKLIEIRQQSQLAGKSFKNDGAANAETFVVGVFA